MKKQIFFYMIKWTSESEIYFLCNKQVNVNKMDIPSISFYFTHVRLDTTLIITFIRGILTKLILLINCILKL